MFVVLCVLLFGISRLTYVLFSLGLNSAGGGGSTKFRKDKIREKNVKLDENRAKRIDKEKTAKQQGAGEKKGRQGKEAGVEVGVHPSRLARNPGLGGR